MSIKIAFEAEKLPFYFVSHKDGRKTFEAQAFDGILTVSVQYDYDRRPLSLNGEINDGDRVEIILLNYRIELYMNGELKDEEWSAGNRLFEIGDVFVPGVNVKVSEYFEKSADSPDVLASFENAEGWYPGGGVFVGDCMPYRRGDEYHVLYLKDRHHHKSKWGLGAHQWEHISTKDFKTWTIHPMAVPITDASEGSICTGSWIKHGDKEYLYYTVRMGRGIPAPIRRSVSYDGYHFEKDRSFGFTISGKYCTASARDPKVVKGDDGLFHMFLTTALIKEEKGCLAHYISKDMETWEDFGEPIYISLSTDQPECPDYFQYNGKYYLVFSLKGKAHYMVSDQPFEDFVMPKDPIIPCASVPKCAEWEGRLIFVGFKAIDGYGGSMTFKAATSDENGTLVFDELSF
ncbi:MAG: hypothetical protein IJY47_00145 [Clostridia bacterium]|nr:hypothetical protein [Clostridia bacterium]